VLEAVADEADGEEDTLHAGRRAGDGVVVGPVYESLRAAQTGFMGLRDPPK
jgi:hypothetical protein